MHTEKIIAIGRSWIGTPYHHQAALKGAGCDCLGLIRGIYRELYGREAETPPPYSPDWAETLGRETMLEAARRHLLEVPRDQMAPGDVLVFRLRLGTVAKHAGLLVTPQTMVHAIEGARVSEVSLGPWWRRRIAGVFRFPEPFSPNLSQPCKSSKK